MKISRKVNRICIVCKKQFIVFQCHLRNEKGGLFCSMYCQRIGRKKKSLNLINKICEECKASFQVKKYRIATAKFCSYNCLAYNRGRRMRGKNHPFWKGGQSNRSWASKKAIRQHIKDFPFCENCGKTENLQGHHVDGYKNNPIKIKTLCVFCHALQHKNLSNWIIKHGEKVDSKNAYEKGSFTQTAWGSSRKENPRFKT